MGEPTSDQQPAVEAPVVQEETTSSPQKNSGYVKNTAGSGAPRNGKYDGNRKNSRPYNQRGNNNNNNGSSSNKHYQKYNQPAYGVSAGYIPNYGVSAEYNPLYYNQYQQQQQLYAAAYQTPMSGQGYVPPVVSPAAVSAKPAKVEITNKSGEHIDIASIAHPHTHSHSQSHSRAVPVVSPPANVTVAAAVSSSVSPSASPAVKVQSPAANGKEQSPAKPEEPKKDTLIVNDFLEQVKRRKAALAAKKAVEEKGPEEPKESVVGTDTDASVDTKTGPTATESAKSEEAQSESQEKTKEEAPAEPKPLTLAEKLRLKRMEAAKQASAKTEELKTEESKPEETKTEELKTEESKPEETKTEELKTEETKSEELKTEEPKAEESKAEEPKPEEPKTEEPTTEQPKSDEPKTEESKTEEPKTEVLKTEEPKSEESKPAEPKTEETATEETATEANAEEGEPAPAGPVETPADVETKPREEAEVEDDGKITMTDFLQKLKEVSPVDDIYSFQYPSDITPPNDRYKKTSIKYAYGPDFLYQFKEKVDVKYDPAWMAEMTSKIVIPPKKPGSSGRGEDRFSKGKVGSLRSEGRSGSRSNSKKKSKRDDRKSNRSYTSRKDRERFREEEVEEPKVEVAPLVPSANRWVPKSKMKKTEVKLAPDGTELYDAEEASRKMKSLLNKLTLEMFEPISDDIMKIANQSRWEEKGETLKIVIQQIFNKACDEPHWSSMYAQLCGKVVKDLDDSIKDSETPDKTGSHLVLHYLVQRCQTEFQTGWTDQLPTNEDGTPLQPEMMSDEYYKMAAAKRRGLGLVRFIGFLYRSNLLTSRMVFFCFKRLMKDIQNSPTEDTLESVCELLETIGEQFEGARIQVTAEAVIEGSSLLDTLFDQIKNVIENGDISSRIKFKLIDIVELREKRNWNSKNKNDGPKTIAQIHEEEALKRALEERERERDRHGSRGGSRRMNSERNSSRRDFSSHSHSHNQNRDGFTTTRSSSVRYSEPKKEEQAPTPTKSSGGAANMFDALMDAEDD